MTRTAPETPCVIYDDSVIERQFQKLSDHLKRHGCPSRIYYALKACYVPPVVQRLVQLGCGLEITSPCEQLIAQRFGLTGDRVIWNGPCLDRQTLRGAVSRGEVVNVDSPHIFHLLEEVAADLRHDISVALRLNPTGQGKLGMTAEQAEALLGRESSVKVVGFHIHVARGKPGSSQSVEEKLRFFDIIENLERKRGVQVRFINLGGSLDVDQDLDDSLTPLMKRLTRLSSSAELWLEPGAFLVEEAGEAYAEVMAVKTLGDIRWALLNIGANFLVPLNRASFGVEIAEQGRDTRSISVGGPFCFEADVLLGTHPIDAKPGDIVRVTRCGGYTASMCSCFYYAPPRIYYRKNGELSCVKRAFEQEELFLSFHGYQNC